MTRGRGPAELTFDVLALVLLAGAVGLYLYAYLGMRSLEQGQIVPEPGEWLMTHWDRYRKASRLALWLGGGGVAAAIWSVIRYGRHRGRP